MTPVYECAPFLPHRVSPLSRFFISFIFTPVSSSSPSHAIHPMNPFERVLFHQSNHTRIQYASPSIMNHLSGTNGTTLHRLFYPTVVSLSLFPSCVFQNHGFFWIAFVFLGFLHNRAMENSDILWQGYLLDCTLDLIIRWLLSTGKSQNDWKKVNLSRIPLTRSSSSSFPRSNCPITNHPSLLQKESLSIQIKHVRTS